MNEEDFFLDENDDDLDSSYIVPTVGEDDEDSGSDEDGEDLSTKKRGGTKATDVSLYENKLSEREIDMQRKYDDIMKLQKDTDIRTTAEIILKANPNNQSTIYTQHILKSIFNTQGHNRMTSGYVRVGTGLNSRDIADELGEDIVEETDALKTLAAKQVADFIGYLASMDYSEDSVMSKKIKQRHIPAFIIFLFSSNLYSLITNCPTMPPVYQKQIDRAFEGLNREKFKLVEDLAKAYEEAGRPEVAEVVRNEGIHWFRKEPKEILNIRKHKDLNLTEKDVQIYKKYRTRYNNISTSITQEVISDYIEVVIDEKKGITDKLKDKTRTKAVDDVKRLYVDWAKENTDNSGLARQLIYGSISNDNEEN
jgi:hypothetical protein